MNILMKDEEFRKILAKNLRNTKFQLNHTITNGNFPQKVSKIHRGFGTPHIAVIISAVFTLIFAATWKQKDSALKMPR